MVKELLQQESADVQVRSKCGNSVQGMTLTLPGIWKCPHFPSQYALVLNLPIALAAQPQHVSLYFLFNMLFQNTKHYVLKLHTDFHLYKCGLSF